MPHRGHLPVSVIPFHPFPSIYSQIMSPLLLLVLHFLRNDVPSKINSHYFSICFLAKFQWNRLPLFLMDMDFFLETNFSHEDLLIDVWITRKTIPCPFYIIISSSLRICDANKLLNFCSDSHFGYNNRSLLTILFC